MLTLTAIFISILCQLLMAVTFMWEAIQHKVVYQRIKSGLLALLFLCIALVFIWSLITEVVRGPSSNWERQP